MVWNRFLLKLGCFLSISILTASAWNQRAVDSIELNNRVDIRDGDSWMYTELKNVPTDIVVYYDSDGRVDTTLNNFATFRYTNQGAYDAMFGISSQMHNGSSGVKIDFAAANSGVVVQWESGGETVYIHKESMSDWDYPLAARFVVTDPKAQINFNYIASLYGASGTKRAAKVRCLQALEVTADRVDLGTLEADDDTEYKRTTKIHVRGTPTSPIKLKMLNNGNTSLKNLNGDSIQVSSSFSGGSTEKNMNIHSSGSAEVDIETKIKGPFSGAGEFSGSLKIEVRYE